MQTDHAYQDCGLVYDELPLAFVQTVVGISYTKIDRFSHTTGPAPEIYHTRSYIDRRRECRMHYDRMQETEHLCCIPTEAEVMDLYSLSCSHSLTRRRDA